MQMKKRILHNFHTANFFVRNVAQRFSKENKEKRMKDTATGFCLLLYRVCMCVLKSCIFQLLFRLIRFFVNSFKLTIQSAKCMSFVLNFFYSYNFFHSPTFSFIYFYSNPFLDEFVSSIGCWSERERSSRSVYWYYRLFTHCWKLFV